MLSIGDWNPGRDLRWIVLLFFFSYVDFLGGDARKSEHDANMEPIKMIKNDEYGYNWL